jgi:hypothetical protein
MKKPSQPKLPGLPERPALAIARSEALDRAFEKLHRALAPLVEGLPSTAESVLSIRRTIQGDQIKVSFKPGQEE